MYDATCSGNTSNVGVVYATPTIGGVRPKAASLPFAKSVMHAWCTLSAYTTITSAYAYGYYGSGTRYAHMTVNSAHVSLRVGIGIPADHYGSALSLTDGTLTLQSI